ncbi:hypothetical protein POV27_15140 [Aureisphaera galaxeae]|uniref:hypothetical protein n=1 Tax=Aureisphaera galaxeae TaxID=1538023 RepID=UPI0023500603|nr:hypothetical protein [Aureisphaera galaxeae]MDC8005397.1 hypothetical protein [Aureisphaera galaxeae]
MKNFVVLFLCAGLLAFTSCSREASIAEESSTADLVVSDASKSMASITVTPQCESFIITVNNCGSGVVLKYTIYDLAGNWVDGGRLTLSGNTHTTNQVLTTGTSYRVVVNAIPCTSFDEIKSTIPDCD